MKILDSNLLEADVVELTLYDSLQGNKNWVIGETAELLEDNGDFYLKQNDLFEEVTLSNLALAKAVNKNDPQVVCCVVCYQNNTSIAVRFIYLKAEHLESIHLYLDSSSIRAISLASGINADYESATKWVSGQFFLNYKNKFGLLCELYTTALTNSFKLIGQKFVATVIKNGKYWYINSVNALQNKPEKLVIFYGSHELKEYKPEELTNTPKQQRLLEQHTQEHGSYFQLWLKYSETHWQQASRIAKSAGYLQYSECKAESTEKIRYSFVLGDNPISVFLNSYKVELESLGERFNLDNLELQVAQSAPDYLTSAESSLDFKSKDSKKPNFLSELLISNGVLEATLTKKPPKKGVIYISLNGIQVQQQRKMLAFDLLRQGNNPLPQVKHIFEGMQPPELRSKRIKALSPKAKKRFKGTPTSQQEKALKIALNTPDIALIIGPPGTGKTQVISALQQRIAEDGDKFGTPIQHQILLTSYQHDAVTNVVSRAGVFGLPAIKVGGREKSNNSDSGVSHWIHERIENLNQSVEGQLEKFPAYKLFQSINDNILSIRLSRKPEELKSELLLLQSKLNAWQVDFGFNIQSDIEDEIEQLISRFKILPSLNLLARHKIIIYRNVRGLRITTESYADDGIQRAEELLDALKLHSETNEFAIKLQELITLKATPAQYITIKDSLLEAFKEPYVLPGSRYITEKEVINLERLQSNLEQQLVKDPVLGQLHIRQSYIGKLKNYPDMVERSISEYVTVLGATCQQAAGNKMMSLKSVPQSDSITFDSVIVDEAARANPLDLMIPMAMARSRIVLVGDHKQLPHMLEPRVEKELQEDNEIEVTQTELLKQSLFERLYHDLTKFEKEGGAVERVVMLDTQFRMHPILGAFHSKEFYESSGLPAVKAGLEEKDFPLDVPGFEDQLAAWISIDQSKGKTKTKNGSKYRICEARVVADEAEKILNERPDLSVGIITFYAAQRDAIQELMVKKGVLRKSFSEYQPVEGYDFLENGDERFRVGSVDAFQGKEFDVVLLSTVRHWKKPNKLTMDNVNQQLGFLRVINRINVAMSRQKRLLIVVGDESLASAELACSIEIGEGTKQQLLPGFNAFYQLCKGEYGCVR